MGGTTNNGAPSRSFDYSQEYATSTAFIEIDLNDIESRDIQTDIYGRDYVYDLPTLDDPNVENVTDGVGEDANGLDENGPWGGNGGLNQAILPADAPIRIVADGLRNAFDIVQTENGNFYTVDNGGNQNFGGSPIIVDGVATNLPNDGGDDDPEPLFLFSSLTRQDLQAMQTGLNSLLNVSKEIAMQQMRLFQLAHHQMA